MKIMVIVILAATLFGCSGPKGTFQITFSATGGYTFLGLGTATDDIFCSWESGVSANIQTVEVGTYRFFQKDLPTDPWQDVTSEVGGPAGGMPFSFEKDKEYWLDRNAVGDFGFNEIPD